MKCVIGESYGKTSVRLSQRSCGQLVYIDSLIETVPYIMLRQKFYRQRLYWAIKSMREALRAAVANGSIPGGNGYAIYFKGRAVP